MIHDFDLFSHTVSSIIVFKTTYNHTILSGFCHNLLINPGGRVAFAASRTEILSEGFI